MLKQMCFKAALNMHNTCDLRCTVHFFFKFKVNQNCGYVHVGCMSSRQAQGTMYTWLQTKGTACLLKIDFYRPVGTHNKNMYKGNIPATQ